MVVSDYSHRRGVAAFAGGMLLILFLLGIHAQAASTDSLELYATAAVLMDGESGRVLYGKEEEVPLPNASTTKILTCILVLEHCELKENVTISSYAASMPKVKLGAIQGETYEVQSLLYSLMLESHNDSAVALAEHVGKRKIPALSEKEEKDLTTEESHLAVRAFAEMMNQKAVEIGCKDTYFLTPNGLDAEEEIALPDGTLEKREHHTTARDLAKILAYAILQSPKQEAFLSLTREPGYSFIANKRGFAFNNHNGFLSMMDGALSGKTGFTGKAGYCYAGALVSEGRVFIVALLGCGWPNHRNYKWKDTRKLMEYGIANFVRKDLLSEEILVPEAALPSVPVSNGQGDGIGAPITVPVCIEERKSKMPARQKVVIGGHVVGGGILLRPEEEIRVLMEIPDDMEAPVTEGQLLGKIRYVLGDEVWHTETIVAAKSVPEINFRWCLLQVLKLFYI